MKIYAHMSTQMTMYDMKFPCPNFLLNIVTDFKCKGLIYLDTSLFYSPPH